MMPRVSKRLRIGENVIKRVTRSSIRNEKNQTLSSSSGVRGGETSPVQRSLSTLAENKEKSQIVEEQSTTKPIKSLKPSISREFEWNFCNEDGKHFSSVIGCDEAGRGPLCGPVVAAAAWISPDVTIDHGIHDSKATSEGQREFMYELLVNHPGVKYSVIRIEHDEIDRINILQASLKAMRLACVEVIEQLETDSNSFVTDDCMCLVDGNKTPSGMPVTTQSVIKGDSLVFSIAAASIIAKISRDRIMTAYDAEYPLYGIARHKGYPTLLHRNILSKYGPSPIHRMSYRPVYESVKKGDIISESEKIFNSKATRKKREDTTEENATDAAEETAAARKVRNIEGGVEKRKLAAAPDVTRISTSSRVTRSSMRKRMQAEASDESTQKKKISRKKK